MKASAGKNDLGRHDGGLEKVILALTSGMICGDVGVLLR